MSVSHHSFDPIGKWWHGGPSTQFGLANSYMLAAAFLDGLPVVEDWGCGAGWARRYFLRSTYVGVDGSKSPHCDVVDDCRTRGTRPDGIMLRHVLEHNPQWVKLLTNALDKFKSRLIVISHLATKPTSILVQNEDAGFPSIWLGEDELLPLITPYRPIIIQTPNNEEISFLFEKK